MAHSYRNQLLISVVWIFVVLLNTVWTSNEKPPSSYEVVFGWKQLDYAFPIDELRAEFIEKKKFIPENNVITGIKVSGSRVFLTVPRWREGVPSTLNYVELDDTSNSSPKLIPYPSSGMQEVGNCDSLQYIQSMEIDQYNRMWVLDIGRVNIFTNPDNKCPPKLLIIDLDTDEVVQKFEFHQRVVSHKTNFLNDIVVGCTSQEDCWAYMTDTLDCKLIVYSMKQSRAWFVHHKTMVADPNMTTISILGEEYPFKVNIDGIALSSKNAKFDRVYYTPLSSNELYSVPTSVLQDAFNTQLLNESEVFHHGSKGGPTDGMAVDSEGRLFYGVLSKNSVSYFDTSDNTLENSKLLVENGEDLQWPDGFAFDNEGYLYMVTNKIHRFSANTLDFSEVNFRVARVFVGTKSYMHSAEDPLESHAQWSKIEL